MDVELQIRKHLARDAQPTVGIIVYMVRVANLLGN